MKRTEESAKSGGTRLPRTFLPAAAAALIALLLPCRAQLAIVSVGTHCDPRLPEGLSGLAYAGSNLYYAVEDSGGRFYALTIDMSATGGIDSVAVLATNICQGAVDLEGIAWNPHAGTLYVSDEHDASIREYAVTGGTARSALPVPEVFARFRRNYGLESLSASRDGRALWTANEEALRGPGVDDGPLASTSMPTVVRLQRWQRASPLAPWRPSGQWAYATERWSAESPFTTAECCGVADLCALTDGRLLVLERELSGYFPTLGNRIYLIDLAGATDVSALSSLRGARYTPVSKRLLWSGDFGMLDNFEGLCLGPALPDGSHCLLMIADGDGAQRESLHALRLTVAGAADPNPLEVRAGTGAPVPPALE